MMILKMSDAGWQEPGMLVLSERIMSGIMVPLPDEKLN
jgi:hypothetical protein